ncbi:hypothetical protein LTR53_007234 [Teratosphaeriaceae sp. CCFEE 6253]|nr:hypothetical protein LTR53_007234 [Teratosphaeriaceae sp. CCFEE 6253]
MKGSQLHVSVLALSPIGAPGSAPRQDHAMVSPNGPVGRRKAKVNSGENANRKILDEHEEMCYRHDQAQSEKDDDDKFEMFLVADIIGQHINRGVTARELSV